MHHSLIPSISRNALLLVASLACAGAAPAGAVFPAPDALTEDSAAQWGAQADDASAAVFNDNTRVRVGSWSIRFETTGGFDTWLWAPIGRNGNWDLTDRGFLRFWVYADNPNIGFQDHSPWIRLGSASGYWQYQTDYDLLNNARGTWLQLTVPLAGSDLWQRTTVGTVSFSDIDFVEIHADTWDSGFTLWIDGLEFVPEHGPLPGPANLDIAGFTTTAHVRWGAVLDPSVAGYEVQRRTPPAPFYPVKRTIARTTFTDYGLTPGGTYEYRVLAIDATGTPVSQFSTVRSLTLGTNPAPYSNHHNFEILFAFYTGGYTSQQISEMRAGIERAMEFYWRTSSGRLNLDATWLMMDAPLPAPQWGSEVESDLRSRGVQNDQFDLAYLIGNRLDGCLGGYVVLGSTCAALGTVCGVPYPESQPGIDYTIAWTFTHEIHHALETMENITEGTPEVLFCHFPWCYPDPLGPSGWHMDWGPHYDGIALTNREYGADWALYPTPYDGYMECMDADHDGLPDSDGRVWLDEARFGSDPARSDTDQDGLDDLAEYAAYNFRSADVHDPDTDGDGLLDGIDPEPLYDVLPYLKELTAPRPVIDGVIEARWPLLASGYYYTQNTAQFTLTSYAGWDGDALYLAFASTRRLRFMLSLDGSGQDGRFASPVRHVTGAMDTDNLDNKHNHIGDSWGDGQHIVFAHGDGTVRVFDRGPISGAQIASGVESSTSTGFTRETIQAPSVSSASSWPGPHPAYPA